MAGQRQKLPDDLKEFCGLIRAGRLFDVQNWITSGKRFQLPEGKFTTSPLRVAFETGFHSMVEVLLRAGVDEHEKGDALRRAVWRRRADMVELLNAYGAAHSAVSVQDVFDCRDPAVIRWFIKQGLDLESGWPIARALKDKHRDFLGIYMDLRDQLPSARVQANMALRYHACEGNLKWVCLLLWAGADPRAQVPDVEHPEWHEAPSSALEEAVSWSRVEVVKKFRIDPRRDDLSKLLCSCWTCREPALIEHLLSLGADPNEACDGKTPMDVLIQGLSWYADPKCLWRDKAEMALRCVEVLACHGGRWQLSNRDSVRSFRTALGACSAYEAVSYLDRMIKCGAIAADTFRDLMDTPRMKELLRSNVSGIVRLREIAGFDGEARRRIRRKREKGIHPGRDYTGKLV